MSSFGLCTGSRHSDWEQQPKTAAVAESGCAREPKRPCSCYARSALGPSPEYWTGQLMAPDQSAQLHAVLRDIIVQELAWDAEKAGRLADVALRRWRSFPRRSKANKRTAELRLQDLIRGLRQGSPIDVIYLEPGDFERLAPVLRDALTDSL